MLGAGWDDQWTEDYGRQGSANQRCEGRARCRVESVAEHLAGEAGEARLVERERKRKNEGQVM
jgi:hypothetical protein